MKVLGEEIIRVAVVDDQKLFARGLSGLVELLPGVEVVGVAYNGEEAIALCRQEVPDVVLMDISMPKMDGISATREIKALLLRTAVVILTGHEEDEHVFEGIKAGAQGYLLKDSEPEDLSRAIHTVFAEDTIVAPDLAQKMLNTFEGGRLEGGVQLAPSPPPPPPLLFSPPFPSSLPFSPPFSSSLFLSLPSFPFSPAASSSLSSHSALLHGAPPPCPPHHLTRTSTAGDPARLLLHTPPVPTPHYPALSGPNIRRQRCPHRRSFKGRSTPNLHRFIRDTLGGQRIQLQS